MKLDFLDSLENKQPSITAALLGVSVVLAVLTLAKAGGYFVGSARADGVIARALERAVADGNDIERYVAPAMAAAEVLKKRNVFAPPEAKRHPVTAVVGILGDEALIEGRWYEAGDRIGDAKIVAIEPTLVRIEWQGGIKDFAPITAAVSAAQQTGRGIESGRRDERDKQEHQRAARVPKAARKEDIEKSLASSRDDSLDWIGVELPEKLKAKILEKWSKASPAERQEAKRQWLAMPDEQKRMVIEQFDRMN